MHPLPRDASPGDTSPSQVMHSPGARPLDFVVTDARDKTETEVQNMLHDESHTGFELLEGPVLRARCYTVAEEDTVMMLCMHHIAIDGWSVAVLIKELCTMYAQALEHPGLDPAEVTAPLPPVAVSYAQYSSWQRAYMSTPEAEGLWPFWQRTLALPLPVISLPTDRPRPAVQGSSGAMFRFELDPQMGAAIGALARAEGCTSYTLLLATWMLLLHKYTSEEDIIVGSPMACRDKLETENVVGYFVNPVAMRLSMEGSHPFPSLLQRLQKNVIAAIVHQEFPFTQLVENLNLPRDASRSPIFQNMFVLEKVYSRNLTLTPTLTGT